MKIVRWLGARVGVCTLYESRHVHVHVTCTLHDGQPGRRRKRISSSCFSASICRTRSRRKDPKGARNKLSMFSLLFISLPSQRTAARTHVRPRFAARAGESSSLIWMELQLHMLIGLGAAAAQCGVTVHALQAEETTGQQLINSRPR